MRAIKFNIPAGQTHFIVHALLRVQADIAAQQYADARGYGKPTYLGTDGLLNDADILDRVFHYRAAT